MFPSLSFHFLPLWRLCITKIHDYITVIDVGSREVAFFYYKKCCSRFVSLILHVVWHQRQNAFYTLGPRLAMTVATSVPVTQAWMRVEQYLLWRIFGSLLAPFRLNVNPFNHTFWILIFFHPFSSFSWIFQQNSSSKRYDFSMLGPIRHRFISLPCFLHPISHNTRTWPLAPPTKAGCRLHRDLPWTRSGNLPQAT